MPNLQSGRPGRAERPSRRYRGALGGAALALAAALVLTGCSGSSAVTGRLAQAASDATAQTRTVALTIEVASRGRSPSTVSSTAIGDAITKLGQDDTALTQLQTVGKPAAMRNEVLSRVRTAEDEALQAQSLLASPTPGTVPSRTLRARLAGTATALLALQKRLEAGS